MMASAAPATTIGDRISVGMVQRLEGSDRARSRARGHGGRSGCHATELLPRSRLAVVDPLHTIAHRPLDIADVRHQTIEATHLDRRGLIASPHGAVERDVPLHEAG